MSLPYETPPAAPTRWRASATRSCAMVDNDEAPSIERSPGAARAALALLLIVVAGMASGAWWAA